MHVTYKHLVISSNGEKLQPSLTSLPPQLFPYFYVTLQPHGSRSLSLLSVLNSSPELPWTHSSPCLLKTLLLSRSLMASVLLNPMVNFVFIFLLTAFDTADGIGFPATLHAQKEGSGSLILLVPWWKRNKAEGSHWRFPLLQPGRDRHLLFSHIIGQNQSSLCPGRGK